MTDGGRGYSFAPSTTRSAMDDTDYTRVYWLSFLVAGLLFTLLSYLDYVAAGSLTLWIGVSLLLGLVIVGVSAYAARYPERAGGPTEPNLRFAIAVGIALLLVGLTLERVLGL